MREPQISLLCGLSVQNNNQSLLIRSIISHLYGKRIKNNRLTPVSRAVVPTWGMGFTIKVGDKSIMSIDNKKEQLLILILHRQQTDYIYDMNTYNAISYIGKEVSFFSLSIELHSYEEILSKVKYFKRIVLMILPEAYDVCKRLVNEITNNSDVQIYAYGAMVSVAPNEVLKDIAGLKGVIVGDSEEIIASMYEGDIQLIKEKCESRVLYGGLFDITKIETASESLIKYGKINSHIRINTTNGCLHDCSFCILNKKYGIPKGSQFFVRNMKDVFDEIVYI